MNTNEIESTISTNVQMINESISTKNLIKVVNEILAFITKIINEGKDSKLWKQLTLNYLSNNNINLQELYNWLLNNQIDSGSIFLHGYFNYYGIEIIKCYEKAFNLFLVASGKNHTLAQFYVGICYYGVEKDLKMAAKWYEKAANNGNIRAMINIGLLYLNGDGVDKDHNKAFELFKQSAEGGDLDGIVNLGYCYENGIGVEKDLKMAAKWYEKAAN